MLLRALCISVTIATSTPGATGAAAEGRTPTVRLPATAFAPRFTSRMTPASRPPLRTTQPSSASNRPRRKALARSPGAAPSPGPITPAIGRGISVSPLPAFRYQPRQPNIIQG